MPARVSRSSLQNGKAPKSKPAGRDPKKAQKRVLDAFSIASHEHPGHVKIRSHRLGKIEEPTRRSKRPRYDDDEDGGEGEEKIGHGKRRRHRRDDDDGESIDEGSDSEGNTWRMGHVDEDDDSDIDSDEAFGESDEEKFEGWTFRGSSSNQKIKKPKRRRDTEEMDDDENGDIDLDEGESADSEEEEEDDDLGEDAIDLAAVLDQYEESEEERKQKKAKKTSDNASGFDDSGEEPSEVGDLASDGASEFSSEEEEEEADRRAQLKGLISSLAEEDEQQSTYNKRADVHESAAPSEYGVLRKVDLVSLKFKLTDPERRKVLKLLQDDKSSNRNDIARKLDAPLPKRQQDKLDRAAASAKANETLERWVDTVKHNRRAEHLSFPLYQPEEGQRMGETRLLPTTIAAPANDLESTIQSILQQSGLSNGKEDEESIQKWEELQTNKLPLEEVMRRRAQLRRERELLFREEVRAKRIKKIKSKAYRRVHRKERERLAQRERDALKADGVDVSEDEREYNDRRRAEERMGAKHRDSKWGKSIKASGRAAWDEDARAGVTEMARRNEELRRRMEGKEVRDENEEGSDFLSGDEDENMDTDDQQDGQLLRQMDRLQNPFSTSNDKESKLSGMAFMKKAEAARKAKNDEDVTRMKRELAGEENSSSAEDENATRAGRRKFGPSQMIEPTIQVERNVFEEPEDSDGEDHGTNRATQSEEPSPDVNRVSDKPITSSRSSSKTGSSFQNPYLVKATKTKKGNQQQEDLLRNSIDTIATIQPPSEKPKVKPKSKSKLKPKPKKPSDADLPDPTIGPPDADGWQTVTYQPQSDEDDEAEDEYDDSDNIIGLNPSQLELTAKAFAGDNVAAEFEAEKSAIVDEEDEKVIENVLPGWGSWTGEALTAREKRQNRPHTTYAQQPGIAPEKRRDARLARVIINEKRVKANTKYLASQLPFPFETRQQYERNLRLPKGPEWTTKRTFEQATKPRVIVKSGSVIRPMHKPLA